MTSPDEVKMHDDRLDDNHESQVYELSKKILILLTEEVKDSEDEKYSHFNIMMNVLCCCMAMGIRKLPDRKSKKTVLDQMYQQIKTNIFMVPDPKTEHQ